MSSPNRTEIIALISGQIDVAHSDLDMEIIRVARNIDTLILDQWLIAEAQVMFWNTESADYKIPHDIYVSIKSVINRISWIQDLWWVLKKYIIHWISSLDEFYTVQELGKNLIWENDAKKILNKLYNDFLRTCPQSNQQEVFTRIAQWDENNTWAYAMYLDVCSLSVLESNFCAFNATFKDDIQARSKFYRVYLSRCDISQLDSIYWEAISMCPSDDTIRTYISRVPQPQLDAKVTEIYENDRLSVNVLCEYFKRCDIDNLNNQFIKYSHLWYSKLIYKTYFNRLNSEEVFVKVFQDMITQFSKLDAWFIQQLQMKYISKCIRLHTLSQSNYDDILMSYIDCRVTNNLFYIFYINCHASQRGCDLLGKDINTLSLLTGENYLLLERRAHKLSLDNKSQDIPKFKKPTEKPKLPTSDSCWDYLERFKNMDFSDAIAALNDLNPENGSEKQGAIMYIQYLLENWAKEDLDDYMIKSLSMFQDSSSIESVCRKYLLEKWKNISKDMITLLVKHDCSVVYDNEHRRYFI